MLHSLDTIFLREAGFAKCLCSQQHVTLATAIAKGDKREQSQSKENTAFNMFTYSH